MSQRVAAMVERFVCSSCSAIFRSGYARCPLCGAVVEPLAGDPLVGKVLHNRYTVAECIGEGGMGRVYRAVHKYTGKEHAIKVLFGDHAADPKMRQRMEQEALAVGKLSHRNVIAVSDAAQTAENSFYLVMDFVRGEDLAEVVAREAPFDRQRVINLMKQLCLGLGHAHDKGLVHRDFKSENVLITRDADGELAKIVDFGIAVVLEAAKAGHKLTSEGMVLGTPAFMSPEQSTGGKVDHRSDLFSLGVLMYEMLCGKLPFDGTPLDIARQNLVATVPRMAERVPGLDVDQDLEDIAFGLMAKRPEDRYQRASDVLQALDAVDRKVVGQEREYVSTEGPTIRAETGLPALVESPHDSGGILLDPGSSGGLQKSHAPARTTHGSRAATAHVEESRRKGGLLFVVLAVFGVAAGLAGFLALRGGQNAEHSSAAIVIEPAAGGDSTAAAGEVDEPVMELEEDADAGAVAAAPADAAVEEAVDVASPESSPAAARRKEAARKARAKRLRERRLKERERRLKERQAAANAKKATVRPPVKGAGSGKPQSRRQEIDAYKRLYERVGRRLNAKGLKKDHRLIRSYFSISFTSGLLNDSLRKSHTRKLRGIERSLKALP